MKRADLRRARADAHHSHQLTRARSPRHRLAAACQYLIAEANRLGDTETDAATAMVLAYATDLKNRPAREGDPT